MTKLRYFIFLVSVVAGLLLVGSCEKENSDPNSLGGTTNIPLTQKDSVTDLYFKVNGVDYSGVTIKVVSNENGLVTYGANVDLKAFPDSLVATLLTMVPKLVDYYKPSNLTWTVSPALVLTVQFKLRITSEGIQNFFVEGKPWTVKYADGVGTKYSLRRDNGEVLTATVTEKTGQDDWPYVFWKIKTSKVEYMPPSDDPVLSKVTFRVNHKFGLVYLQAEGKDGKVIEVDLVTFFLL